MLESRLTNVSPESEVGVRHVHSRTPCTHPDMGPGTRSWPHIGAQPTPH